MRKLATYLVEDNPTIRAHLIATLEDLADIECVGFADNKADAVNWLREHASDWELALVDLFLRQGSGVGVLAELTQRSALQKVAVVSNYASNNMAQRCLELGCDRVFDKSADIEVLIEYCQSLPRN